MNDPKICIIGAGVLSSRRIYPYIGAAGGQLAGVCDIDTEKAERNARRFGGKVYNDYNVMIENEKPDGVIICINAEKHALMAMEIMKKNIPVYTEKPPAVSAAAALETARISKETGVLCSTAFKKRYNTAYSKAKNWLDKFDPSELCCISVDYSSMPYKNEGLRTFLFDFAIHIIDLTVYLFGNVKQVFCFSKGSNAYAVSLKFENGAVGSLSLTDTRAAGVPTEEVEISVQDSNFMTVHNSSCWKITEKGKPCEWREPPTYTSGGDSGNETGHLAEIADFFDAIKNNRTTRSNIYESYKTMVLYEAIKKSSETGEIVDIHYEIL